MSEVGVSPIRCVVGDDHDVLRSGLIMFLKSRDDVEVVGDGADGSTVLGLIERRRPEVAVLDLKMPGLDGVEVCAEIMARSLPTAAIIYTAFSEARGVDEALEAGASGFVLKASPAEDLLRAISVVHGGGTFVDATLATDLIRLRQESGRELLSNREREVLQLLASGLTTESVASNLFLAPTTVRSYAETAMSKLGCRNRTEAVAKALRLSLIS